MVDATLLIVEDDGILAAHLADTVTRLGYTVLGPVATGEEAITFLGNHPPNLVLMDIELAGKLNGIQAAELITRATDVPIIFMTAYSHDVLLEQAKNVNPHGYLIKPVSERELVATLTMCLQRHALDRKLQESRAALEKSEAKYRHLFEHSPVGIFRSSLEGKVLAVNAEVARMVCCGSPEDILRESVDLAHQFYIPPHRRREFITQLRKNGVVQDFEFEGKNTKGETIWMSMNAKMTPCDEDNKQFVDGFVMDITARKRAEEQLQAMNDELERRVEQRTRELQETQKQYLHAEKLSAIGKLSASIAHEFNNPLQGILSILKGLRKRAVLQEEDKELLNAAIEEGDRIKDLIRNLQEFNRPSSGRKVVMDVHKALDSILLLHKSDFKSKRITLVQNYAKHLPQILAIPDQIKQVFLNLLTNAADACQQGGGTITINTWLDGQRVAVAVKDTGVGIKPEEGEQIFRPFYTTKSETRGTGLGLSISYNIVKNHQGEIRVESQPGEGATFTVLLPVKSDSEPVAGAEG